MSNKLHFKLFANCIPVRGALESIIMDLQREEYFPVPNELMDVLELTYRNLSVDEVKKHFNNEYDQGIEAYFNLFEENEYGFYTDEPELFPEITKDFEFPSKIVSSVICLNQNTKFNLRAVLNQLDKLCCQTIQIRILDSFPIEIIKETLEDLSKSDVKIIELLIPNKLASETELIELMHTSLRVSIVVYSAPSAKKTPIKRHRNRYIFFIKDSIGKESQQLYGKHLMNCNMKFYCESLSYNVGLNKKISIDETGKIFNYFGHQENFGNIDGIDLAKLLLDEKFTHKWLINNDIIEKCKICQYRYMCHSNSDIRMEDNKYYKVDDCGFDPLSNKWN